MQSRGIGTPLVEAAEELARSRGHNMVGLAVGVENVRAHELYSRLGFRDWSHGTFRTTWVVTEADGSEWEAFEEVIYMTKGLSPP